jgi:hypothetical protein
MYNFSATLAIPPHSIDRLVWSLLLQHDPDSVCKSDGVMRCIPWQQVQRILVYRNVDEGRGCCGCVYGFEEHGTLVLIEEFGCFIDVVVRSGIGAAHHHDREARGLWGGRMVHAVVVDGRL